MSEDKSRLFAAKLQEVLKRDGISNTPSNPHYDTAVGVAHQELRAQGKGIDLSSGEGGTGETSAYLSTRPSRPTGVAVLKRPGEPDLKYDPLLTHQGKPRKP